MIGIVSWLFAINNLAADADKRFVSSHVRYCIYYLSILLGFVAAQEATANAYLPILAGVNLLYILLLLGLSQTWTTWRIAGVLTTWAFQIVAYFGILESAKNNNKNKKKDLVGGANLDLLALTVVVQFGSALHSFKWFYLLWIAPIYGGWLLYSNFFGGKKPTGNGASGDESVAVSKEKRTKKRGQTRG